MEQTPPGAGKTPTIPIRVADLAAGGIGTERNYSVYAQPGTTCIHLLIATASTDASVHMCYCVQMSIIIGGEISVCANN